MTTSFLEGLTSGQIDTVKAFAHAIQNRSIDDIEFRSGLTTWKRKPIPTFEIDVAYRIKPQPKIVPFTFNDADSLRGKWIKHKDHKFEFCVVSLSHYGFTSPITVSYKNLLLDYEFLDGSPCGKKEL